MRCILRLSSRLSTWVLSIAAGGFLCTNVPVAQAQSVSEYTIPMESNTFVTKKNADAQPSQKNRVMTHVGREGLFFSSDTGSTASTFIYFSKADKPRFRIRVKGKGTLDVRCGKQTKRLRIDTKEWEDKDLGRMSVQGGYTHLDFKCSGNEEKQFILVQKLFVADTEQEPLFIKENFSAHFGRRGPSVHLQYALPKHKTIEWFYNEVTVPPSGDVVGSYYCAQGFSCGYFGIQNNSPHERRVLFSVWSPFDTQDPALIPEKDKIVVLKKGENVQSNEFGNEGAGGQTFLRYNWKAGNTYRFLLHALPDNSGSTTFTAYFYAPEENRWLLIASLRRPRTQHFVAGSYSFVENFNPNMGYLNRKAYFGNAWAYTSKKEWKPVLHTTVTNDDTGHNGVRVDYGGGTEGNRFFLQMGGFTGNGLLAERQLYIKETGTCPKIDFTSLPNK